MSAEDISVLIQFGLWILFAAWAWERGTGRGRTSRAWRVFQVGLPILALVTMFLMRKTQRSDCPDATIAAATKEPRP